MATLKEMVQKGRVVNFYRYQKGELWYKTETGFEFPVPINDTGDGEFWAQDKASFFMRWISAHMKMLEAAKNAEMIVDIQKDQAAGQSSIG